MKKFLIIGAFGQIGTELVPALQKKYGHDNVIALAHKVTTNKFQAIVEEGDVLDPKKISAVIDKYKITDVVNFASYLSVKSELDPQGAWQVNLLGLKNTLDIAKEKKFSSFGPHQLPFLVRLPQKSTLPKRQSSSQQPCMESLKGPVNFYVNTIF